MPPTTSIPSSTSSSFNKGRNNKNNRGRFFQLASSSLRRPQKKTGKAATAGVEKPSGERGRGGGEGRGKGKSNNNPHTRNDIFSKENSRPSSLLTSDPTTTGYNHNNNNGNQYSYYPQQNQQQTQQSSMPVGDGFSRAELYDIEESFKLFDIYDEGSVQVGDLRSILGVLQQEHQQQSTNDNDNGFYYKHLDTLLKKLSQLSDEDNLSADDYVKLMSSTSTITNDDNDDETEDDNGSYFIRVFRLFDIDGKGYITVDDLKRAAVELGEHDMSIEEIKEMIDRAITGTSSSNNNEGAGNNDGRVYIEDFTRMMTMNLFSQTTSTATSDMNDGGLDRDEQ